MTAPECSVTFKSKLQSTDAAQMDPAAAHPNSSMYDDIKRASMRDDVLVVLPTFNEAENLEAIAAAVLPRNAWSASSILISTPPASA